MHTQFRFMMIPRKGVVEDRIQEQVNAGYREWGNVIGRCGLASLETWNDCIFGTPEDNGCRTLRYIMGVKWERPPRDLDERRRCLKPSMTYTEKRFVCVLCPAPRVPEDMDSVTTFANVESYAIGKRKSSAFSEYV